MSNAISTIQQNLTFEQMREQANILLKSGFLPSAIRTPEQALTIMLTGRELNLGMMESLRSINVIQGKPTMSAQLLLGLCRRTGQVESAGFEKETDTECVFVLKRTGSPAYRSVFTIEDAKKLNLAGKDNYIKQAKTMLGWRAISKACRFVFPDAISGLYTPEEIAADVHVEEIGGEAVVTEIQERPVQTMPQVEVDRKEGTIPPRDMTPETLAEFELITPEWKLKFPGLTLFKIWLLKTDGGIKRGEKFLETVAQYSKDAREKEAVTCFLTFASQGAYGEN